MLWRGADIDRVLDERHAQLVAVVAERLTLFTWEVSVEVTFSEYGERGSIDVLAVRAPATTLVVEVKTEIASVEEMLRRLDMKARLAPKIVFDRHGWAPVGDRDGPRCAGGVHGATAGEAARFGP